MSKRIVRFISMTLSVCLIILASGCNSSKKSSKTKVNTGGVTKDRIKIIDESTDQLNFFKDGLFNFNIIIPDEYTDEQYHMVKETVFAQARSVNNKRPNFYRESSSKENGLKNIYIGNTTASISKEALDLINEDGAYFEEYVIMVKDDNIAINALNDTATKNALEYFDKNILKDKDSTIGNKYTYHFEGSNNDNITISNIPISSFIINCTDYPQGMVIRGCEELQKSIKEASGYELQILKGFDDKYKHRIQVIEEGSDLDAYSIKATKDGNLIVSGGHGYSINAALHQLSKNLSFADKSKKINIPAGKILSGKYDSDTLNSDGYKLVFADEFNGNSVDTDIWNVNEWDADQLQYCVRKKAISVENGSLRMQSFPGKLENGSDGYIGGELEGKKHFSYGYFEIRAKMPVGTGHQTAFWTNGTYDNYSQPYMCEIDVFETFGAKDLLISGIHSWWKSDLTIKGLKCTEAQQAAGHIQHFQEHGSEMDGGRRYEIPLKNGEKDVWESWHTFGCEWTPSYINFYCDGYKYCTVNMDTALVDPETGEKVSEYMMFTSGRKARFKLWHMFMVHKLVKPISEETEIPSNFYVDYIHLYQVPSTGIYS